MKKRILAAILTLSMVVSMTACGNSDAGGEVGVHKASYSDIDVLGHTNNARYVVWAMDSIDYGEVAGNRAVSYTHLNQGVVGSSPT